MSGGVLFVICIPTERAERKLDSDEVTPTPSGRSADVHTLQVPAMSGGGAGRLSNADTVTASEMRGSFGSTHSPQMHVANEGNLFQPTPRSSITNSASASASLCSATKNKPATGSREVLVQIEFPSDEYENNTQATVTSVDDIGIGMPKHPAGDALKRTKSDNALLSQPNGDATMPTTEPNSTTRRSWDGYIKDLMQSAQKKSTKSPAIQRGSVATIEPSLNIENHSSMERVMREILIKMRMTRAAVWQTDAGGESWQIVFSVGGGYAQERVLTMLTEWGIGEREGSTVAMVPCTVLMCKPEPGAGDEAGDLMDEQEQAYDKTANAWDRFMNSMRARLNVAQIVESVKQDATISFDFLSLLIIAAVLAAFGLVENSTIFLASSMLISPLMGPIIAATFGTVIKDPSLTKFGIVNELIGILITTCVGFVFGLIVFNVEDRFSRGEGLTQEMLSRTDTHSLIVGIFIAIPSGAAVAISILGENIGSLVGVAISASLLPPAVNSGLLWALAVMFMSHREDAEKYNTVVDSSKWSDHQAVELFVLGSISMAVTISNVLCVYVAGAVFLKIKEVAPIVSREQRQFWKHDVKVARDFNAKATGNNTANGGGGGGGLTGTPLVGGSASPLAAPLDTASMTQKWVEEFGDFAGTDIERLGLNAELLRNVGRPAYQQTWSPRTLRHNQFHQADARRSLEEFEQLYMTMSAQHPMAQAGGNPAVARHFSISGPSSKAAASLYKRQSPPKYRSLLHDHIFTSAAAAAAQQQQQLRRQSMPYFLSASMAGTSPLQAHPSGAGTATDAGSAGGAGAGCSSRASKVKVAKAAAAVARLSKIPEVSSQSSLSPLPSTSAAAAAAGDAHTEFERRAAHAAGRKFIVTPAKVDPLLERSRSRSPRKD